jgi:hypothetical protein
MARDIDSVVDKAQTGRSAPTKKMSKRKSRKTASSVRVNQRLRDAQTTDNSQ